MYGVTSLLVGKKYAQTIKNNEIIGAQTSDTPDTEEKTLSTNNKQKPVLNRNNA